MGAIIDLGFTGHGLRVHLPVLVDLDLGVNSPDAVESHHATGSRAESVWRCMQFAVGEDESDAVVFPNLPVDAQHPEEGVLARERVGFNYALARRAVIGHKRPDGPPVYLARKPHAVQRINNTAAC